MRSNKDEIKHCWVYSGVTEVRGVLKASFDFKCFVNGQAVAASNVRSPNWAMLDKNELRDPSIGSLPAIHGIPKPLRMRGFRAIIATENFNRAVARPVEAVIIPMVAPQNSNFEQRQMAAQTPLEGGPKFNGGMG